MAKAKEKRQLLVIIGCVLDFDTQQTEKPKILLARRKEAEQKEIHLMWELPGGKVDFGETPEQTVLREVEEETGYQVEIVQLLPFSYTTQWDYADFRLQTLIYCYECKVLQRPTRPIPQEHKIKEIKWFAFNEIDFSHVLPGSREFIWHVAKQYSVDLTQYNPKVNVAYANFSRIKPNEDKNTFYSIVLQIDPNAELPYIVTRRWGRLNWNGYQQHDVRSFASDKEARKEIRPRLKRRKYRGYAIEDNSDNFPLKDILEQFPKSEKARRQLSLW